MLDNFALLSGQISSLNRLMKNEKMPIFRNYALLPLVLSPDRDPQLEVRSLRSLLLNLPGYTHSLGRLEICFELSVKFDCLDCFTRHCGQSVQRRTQNDCAKVRTSHLCC